MDKHFQNSRTILNTTAIAVVVIVCCSCSATNSMRSHNSSSAKLSSNYLKDRDGNKYPVKILLDGNQWATANLNLNIPDSYCYENKNENCEKYGRLYTWASATQGCALLGEGWRLPTDAEWLNLSSVYGGAGEDSKSKAYQLLLSPGTSGFNAVLGGNRDLDGTYARKEAHGFYWTATENDPNAAWYYNFGKGSLALHQQDGGEKTRGFSVRCVKSTGEKIK